MKKIIYCTFFVILFVIVPTLGFSEDSKQEEVRALEAQIESLDQRITVLENKADLPVSKPIAPLTLGNAKDRANWRQLKKGMNEKQVIALLGEADKVDMYSSFYIWYYGNYPDKGEVRFTPSGALKSWYEP